jgi:hypothetical protein
MGFEKSHLFGKCEVDIRASVAGTIVFQTETPGQTLTTRFAMPIPITSGRTVLRSRLPGTMQGHYVKTTGTPGTTPTGHWELYGVRVWSRELPDGQWTWTALPVMDTPVEYIRFDILEDPTQGAGAGSSVGFSEYKIPVEPTPEMYQEFKLPVEPTPESFSELKLAVEPTGETFTQMPISVEATPAEFSMYKFQVPPTPEDYTVFQFPVEATPESYSEYKFPVKPTPPVPLWVGVEVDD